MQGLEPDTAALCFICTPRQGSNLDSASVGFPHSAVELCVVFQIGQDGGQIGQNDIGLPEAGSRKSQQAGPRPELEHSHRPCFPSAAPFFLMTMNGRE